MLEVLVDAHVIAVPEDAGAFEHYINQLLALQQMVDTEGISVTAGADTIDVLADRYPVWGNIPQSEEIAPQDVTRVLGRLLATPAEDRVGVVLFDLSDPRCFPTVHLTGRHEAMILHHHRLLFLALLVKENLGREPMVLTDTALLDKEQPCIQVHAEGTAVVALHGQDELVERAYVSAVTVVGSMDDLVRCSDPVALWEIPGSEILALEIYLAQRRGSYELPTGLQWSLGKEFLDGAAAHGFHHEPSKIRRLLEACADVVLSVRRGEPHEIRTGQGGNNPAVVRGKDGALAMRRDIDDEFHLHWWRTPSGPEFAWMGVHWDLRIPE